MVDFQVDAPPHGGQVLSGFVSHHHSPPPRHAWFREWNENNVGIGYKTRNGFVLTAFKNSEHGQGLLAAQEIDITKRRSASTGAWYGLRTGLGVVLGYKHMPVAPAAYPSGFASIAGFELVVGYVPNLGRLNNSAVTWAQLRYRN